MNTLVSLVLVATTLSLGAAGCAHHRPHNRITVTAVNNWDAPKDPSRANRRRLGYVKVDNTTALNHTAAAWEYEGRYGQPGMIAPLPTGGTKEAILASERPDVCDQTIYFDNASAQLTASAERKLRKVARCMSHEGGRATVVGRTDPSGSSEKNLALGAARANAVADYLESQGVSANELKRMSVGESGAKAELTNWPLDRQTQVDVNEH